MSISRLRTIRQCLVEIKKLDGETAVSERLIRSLCKSGKVQYIASGTKSLVNLDDLLRFLNFGCGEV